MRVRLNYTGSGVEEFGSRFYLSYSGAAPTASNCATIASDISGAWGTHIASLVATYYGLAEVDVLDIATVTGASGQYSTVVDGSRGTGLIPLSVAMNTEFTISRRYRGGKPRMFWPPGIESDLSDNAHWAGSFVTAVTTGVEAFFNEIEALSVGSVGTLAHVNLSYYKGFTNITNSSGRERAVPTYRDSALLDTITGYNAKALVGSQRRRRTSTTY